MAQQNVQPTQTAYVATESMAAPAEPPAPVEAQVIAKSKKKKK
jgi:hypothetical protein